MPEAGGVLRLRKRYEHMLLHYHLASKHASGIMGSGVRGSPMFRGEVW